MKLSAALLLTAGIVCHGASQAASELEQRARISASVQRAFINDDFRQLEEMAQGYRSTRSRTASGLWHLTLFYAGITASIDLVQGGSEREAAFAELEDRTARWARRYPGSPTPHIAHSIVLIAHGGAIRGGSYASAVPPEAWAPFRRYIAMARENLEEHKAVAAADPRWYETMLGVARAEGWERGRFDRLLDEALGREPLFYQTYFQALEYLLPKWHGDAEAIELFAQDAVKRTSAQEGRGMYARIYWFASQTEFENDLFGQSLAVWPQMKAGFDDVITRYPDAWNLNNFARFACLAGDNAQMQELLERIGTDIVREAWRPDGLIEECMDQAARPRERRRRDLEGA